MPRRRPRRPLLARALAAAALVFLAAACGGDDGPGELGDDRADQVRAAAIEAGLPSEVADVLALAARGTTATFQVTYPGTDGASVIVSQEPPDHRFDVVAGDAVVESRVVRSGVTYRCSPVEGARPGDPLDCSRSDAAVEPAGVFTQAALEDFSEALVAGADEHDLGVEDRTIAGVDATCLVAEPRSPSDGDDSPDTLCLSPEGAQLLTERDGERLVADTYTTDVPEGTFDV